MPRHDTNRYFIELHIGDAEAVPRNREAELRRAQATAFIGQLASWLDAQELADKVSSLAITALGQVQITCEQDIIAQLRGDETFPIAAIRVGAGLTDAVQRWGGR